MPTARTYNRKPKLSISHPALFAELKASRNPEINLSKLTAGSGLKPVWTCSVCSHEWQVSVNNRTYYNTGCPNCLELNRPEKKETTPRILIPLYIAHYNVFKELTVPDASLSRGSNKRVSWTCSVCQHQWLTIVNYRTTKNSGCPECARRNYVGTSKLEYRFFDVMSNHPDISDLKHGVILDQKFESGRKMTVDFSFTHIPTGTYVYMEIDGKRWHKDEAQFKLDEYKTNKLLEETDAYIVRTRNDGLDFLNINHERLRQVNFKWSTNEGPVEAMVKDILEGICS